LGTWTTPVRRGTGNSGHRHRRINIDTDADAHADAAFTFAFSELRDGRQTGTAYFATGPKAREPEPGGDVLIRDTPVGFDGTARPVQAGPVRLFAGVRSDMLSTDPEIGVWATVSVRRDGALVQVDRGGHPTINPFVNPNNVKNEYNLRRPADDLANYLELWSTLLEDNGYPPEEAEAAARIVLPDILRYDRSQPAAYPNGRTLTDDAFSARFAWLTHGRVGPDGLKPHDDLLSEFPYLGPPNLYPV
jgi:hypothetical protein